jgi:hypothetical protein
MGEQQSQEPQSPAAIPCWIVLRDPGEAEPIPAEAVRLDRRGGVLRIVEPLEAPCVEVQSEVLVSIDLPEGPNQRERRRLCFRAGVRHVSRGLAQDHWVGVSFQEAAICSSGPCCLRLWSLAGQ